MNNINWADCFKSGQLRYPLIFMAKWNLTPNRYYYELGKTEIDVAGTQLDKIKAEFPNCVINTFLHRSAQTTSCVEDDLIDDEDDFDYITGELKSGAIKVITEEKAIFEIDQESVLLWYHDQDPEELISRLMKCVATKVEVSNKAEVRLVAYNQGYYTITSKIEPTTIDIDANYNDDFKPVAEDIEKFLDSRKSGIVLLRGIFGSGKTSWIRNLINNHPANYVIVPNGIAANLSSPEFIDFLLSNRNSVFILEDCEQILMERDEMNFGSAVANILNMSDGLMSDIFNIKFICTFNADINKIDKAITRKGRCFANYEFKKLCKEKTEKLMKSRGIELPDYEPLTLAEIYNYADTDYSGKKDKKKKSKLGFDVNAD